MERFDASRQEFSPYGFTCVKWTPTAMPKPDRHNEIELNYLSSGSVTYLMGGERKTILAGQLAAFWAAIPHQIVSWESEQPYYEATLPLAWFLECRLPDSLTDRLLDGEIVSDTDSETDVLRFERWSSDLSSSNERMAEAALFEIRARMLRMSHSLPKQTGEKQLPVRSAPQGLGRADELALYIAQHFTEAITTEQVARAAGLHPNYAMNVFRKVFGVTMTQFTNQHRLYNAQRLLVSTNNPVLEVAFASGFQSLSRFNELFKRTFKCTPRDYRNAHR